ncbi:MAG TPA: GIY-YIG nuclease family protein [Gallicola sp.]|nr:GIY-YIG nuclease family protein [Gallicola sp.]
MTRLTKISGIYQIKNRINNKKYIGHSINITYRWYTHTSNLMENVHPNKELQEDFNKYGIDVFDFSVLELVSGKKKLIEKEQMYLNKLDFRNNYNVHRAIAEKHIFDKESFIKYIRDKWLVPDGVVDAEELDKYKIYKEEDKEEIIKYAIDCNLLNKYPSQITFINIIKYMINELGFNIISKREQRINRGQYTYKLIIKI